MLKKNAFTIMETLVAISIIGFTLFSISRYQVGALLRFRKYKNEVEALYPIKNKVMQNSFVAISAELLDEDKESIEKLPSPEMKLISKYKPISKKSSLSEFKKFLNIVECRGEFGDKVNPNSMTLVTLDFTKGNDE